MRTLPKALEPYKWKPGQSGNPKGRPPRPSMESVIEGILDEMIEVPADPEKPEGQKVKVSGREIAGRVFVELLFQGNARMMAEYLDRKWPRTHLVGGSEGHPLTLADLVKKAGPDPGGTAKKRTARKKAPGRRKATK